jgi:hypothetical protein
MDLHGTWRELDVLNNPLPGAPTFDAARVTDWWTVPRVADAAGRQNNGGTRFTNSTEAEAFSKSCGLGLRHFSMVEAS